MDYNEVTNYRTARTLALLAGQKQVADLLGETRNKEKATDTILTSTAADEVNQQATQR